MTLNAVEQYRHYRVPHQPGSSLVDPPFVDILHSLQQPTAIAETGQLEFCGKPLDLVRQQARAEVVSLAVDHTSRYASPDAIPVDLAEKRAVVLSGHQPELFHPGVWFKNFLLSELARRTGAISINFLVDNDVCRQTSIKVPCKSQEGSITTKSIAFDGWREPVPWELRGLESSEVWRQFPQQVSTQLASLGIENPLLTQMWPNTFDALQRCGRIGIALAEARHRLELSEGLQTLEVPLSQLVSTRSFARFSIQLMAELPRFQDSYNGQREAYRAANRIRNAAHPVPVLEQKDGWLEGPWWVYRAGAPQRRRLWVRMVNDQLFLSDRAGWQEVIEGRLDCDNAASQWLDILADGICLRPRALLTTMYLRLFVGDLFVHGIGGGMYDQITDGILQEFFGVAAPPLAVATATMCLPVDQPGLQGVEQIQEQIRRRKEQLWSYRHQAEHLAADLGPAAMQLATRKKELLQAIPPRGDKWAWHQEMSKLNAELSKLAATRSQATRQELENLSSELRQSQALHSREASFCLYPRQEIMPQLKRLAAGA